MGDRMAGGAVRRGRRGFLVEPRWLTLGLLLAAVPMTLFALQVSFTLVRSDITKVNVANKVYDVALYRVGQGDQSSGSRSALPQGFAFVKGAAWRMTDSKAQTGGFWFALHRVREGRNYCGLIPETGDLDYEVLLAQLKSLPPIGLSDRWASTRSSPAVRMDIGRNIRMQVGYEQWRGGSDLSFPDRLSLVRALFPGCEILPWNQIAASEADGVAPAEVGAFHPDLAGTAMEPGAAAGSESPPEAVAPVLPTATPAVNGDVSASGASVQGQVAPARSGSMDLSAQPVATKPDAPVAPNAARAQAGSPCEPADPAPLGLSLDLWFPVLTALSLLTLLALGLAQFVRWRRPGGTPAPAPSPPVPREDARTLGAIEGLRGRVDEVSGRLGAGLAALESALTGLRSRCEVPTAPPASSGDLGELLGLCREIRAALGDEAAVRLDRVGQAALEAAHKGEETAQRLTRQLAAREAAGEQERRESAAQLESLRAANAGLEAALGACRHWLTADLQAAGYLDAALDPGGADLAAGVLDEAAGLWLRDARERPELQLYVRRLIGLRDYLGAPEVQRFPHFAAAGLDLVLERLREKATFRALYQSVTPHESMLGQWYHFVQSIFRALLLLDSYWPGSTDPELRARLVQCVEAAGQTLGRHGIRPHRLELPVEVAWIAERRSWVELSQMPSHAPLAQDPEFRTRMAGLAAATTVCFDVAVWGYDLADETHSKSLLIGKEPGSAWPT